MDVTFQGEAGAPKHPFNHRGQRPGRWAGGTVSGVLDAETLMSGRARSYVHARWPETGPAWLEGLAGRVEQRCEEWQLELDEVMGGGRSCVLGGRPADGTPAVLKLVVDGRWVAREAAALRHWHDQGFSPAVVAADGEALLLQRVAARALGTDDTERCGDVARLLAAASRGVAPVGVPRIDPETSMASAARRCRGRFPERWAWLAADRARDLLAVSPVVLCHGDLVPGNILDAGEALVLIDPEPRLAPLACDLALLALRFGEGSEFDALADEIARAAGVSAREVLAWGPVLAYAQCAWRSGGYVPPSLVALAARLERRHR
jgi:streptomycin 6-kinase